MQVDHKGPALGDDPPTTPNQPLFFPGYESRCREYFEKQYRKRIELNLRLNHGQTLVKSLEKIQLNA